MAPLYWRDFWKMFPWDRGSSSWHVYFMGLLSGLKPGPPESYRTSFTDDMDLIDSHAHVDVSDFDADRDAMLARAQSVGVGTMLAIGNGPEIEKLGAAVPYAEQYDWIYAAAGIHPHEARHATEAHFEELTRL